jgi:hypothetical protein
MAAESYIQGIARFLVGFGTEQDAVWRDYNLDFAGTITYDKAGNPMMFAPVGNSGYSLGSLQWDFGQGPTLAGPFIEAFVAWFANNATAAALKSDPEFAKRALAMQGKALIAKPALGLMEQDVQALSEFVRTDVGGDWVNTNIDQNLIGNDAQSNIVVLGKKFGLTLVKVAREVEATKTFKAFAAQGNVDATDLVYAIGMKTYNQSPGTFTKKLLLFLDGAPALQDIADWYKQFSGGLRSGVGAATDLSQFWSVWRKANPGQFLIDLENEMTTQALTNPELISKTHGIYVIAKQVFENTDRFDKFVAARTKATDFIDKKLFDKKTGKILIHPVTGRLRPGLLVKDKFAYAWDAAGNAYSAAANAWTPFPVANIHV